MRAPDESIGGRALRLAIRPITPADQATLWDILHEALWDPPPAPKRPREVLTRPGIAAYVENWGEKPEDLGFLALVEKTIAGGIWSRLLRPPLAGGAFYDEETPQIGIAVFPPFQGHGLGTALFEAYLSASRERFPRVSLGVHPQNERALRLYRRFGFRPFATGAGGYFNLVKDL